MLEDEVANVEPVLLQQQEQPSFAFLRRSLQSRSCCRDVEEDTTAIAPGTIFFIASAACLLWCCGPPLLEYLKKCLLRFAFRISPQSAEAQRANEDGGGGGAAASQELANATLSQEHRRVLINSMLQTKQYESRDQGDTSTAKSTASSDDDGLESSVFVESETVEPYTTEPTKTNDATDMEEPSNHEDDNSAPDPSPGGHCHCHINEDDEQDGCVICLNQYEEGEIIAWSHNKKCEHLFHHQCIMEWLLKHDECPICRNNFMLESTKSDSHDRGGGHGENNNTSSTSRLNAEAQRTPPNNTRTVEALLDDESSEHSLPSQLVRGLELLYRAQFSSSNAQLRFLSEQQQQQQQAEQGTEEALPSGVSSPPRSTTRMRSEETTMSPVDGRGTTHGTFGEILNV
ncbi:hypothetical protein ACA910_013364 [Epithemia clementina (nom. ined.)]